MLQTAAPGCARKTALGTQESARAALRGAGRAAELALAGSVEQGIAEIGVLDAGAAKAATGGNRAAQNRAAQVSGAEISPIHQGVAEVSAIEISIGEGRLGEDRATEIGAGTEVTASAGEREHSRARVRCRSERGIKSGERIVIERVSPLGPIDGDERDVVPLFEMNHGGNVVPRRSVPEDQCSGGAAGTIAAIAVHDCGAAPSPVPSEASQYSAQFDRCAPATSAAPSAAASAERPCRRAAIHSRYDSCGQAGPRQ